MDCWPDLAVSTPTGLTVWNNRVARGFSKGTRYVAVTSATAVIAGNFNDDAFTDLAVINEDTNQASVLLNNGGKGFHEAAPMDMEGGPSALAAARFAHSGINR